MKKRSSRKARKKRPRQRRSDRWTTTCNSTRTFYSPWTSRPSGGSRSSKGFRPAAQLDEQQATWLGRTLPPSRGALAVCSRRITSEKISRTTKPKRKQRRHFCAIRDSTSMATWRSLDHKAPALSSMLIQRQTVLAMTEPSTWA